MERCAVCRPSLHLELRLETLDWAQLEQIKKQLFAFKQKHKSRLYKFSTCMRLHYLLFNDDDVSIKKLQLRKLMTNHQF